MTVDLPQYNITVTASDGKYEDNHAVIIEVENQNDVAPVFDKPSYAKSMQEGYRSSTPIIKVSVMKSVTPPSRYQMARHLHIY